MSNRIEAVKRRYCYIRQDYRPAHFNHARPSEVYMHCGWVSLLGEKQWRGPRVSPGCPPNQIRTGQSFYNKADPAGGGEFRELMAGPGVCRVILQWNQRVSRIFLQSKCISCQTWNWFELNFTRILYKIIAPLGRKVCDSLCWGNLVHGSEVSEHMTTWDARRFWIWEPGRIASCLWDRKFGSILKGEFRKRTEGGVEPVLWCRLWCPFGSGAKDEKRQLQVYPGDIDEWNEELLAQ